MGGRGSYHFVTNWRLEGSVDEVAGILVRANELPRWWPSVYLSVTEIEPGDSVGIGKTIRVRAKGWLPYTLNWQFKLVSSDFPNSFTLEATGEWVGRGIWTLKQEGELVRATYDWKIAPSGRLLRAFTPLLRPMFNANHKWAMARGREALELELRRLRSKSDHELRAVPPPRKPTFKRLIGRYLSAD